MNRLKFALVFWTDSQTTSVVSVKALKGEQKEGSQCEVVWHDKKKYVAKIVKLGEKDELEKCKVDRNGNLHDPSRGPESSSSIARKREILDMKKRVADSQKASKYNMEKEVLEKLAHASEPAPSASTSAFSIAEDDAAAGAQTIIEGQLLEHIPASASTTSSSTQAPANTEQAPATTEQASATDQASGVTTASRMGTAAINISCTCMFCTEVAPFVTAENVGFLDRVVTCMKRSLSEKVCSGDSELDQRPHETYPCSFPFKGAVELIPGSRVWISKQTREMILARNINHPKEMLRQFLKTCIGEEYLRKCSARGQGGYQAVPFSVLDAATALVETKCQTKVDVTKVINNLCTGLRRPKDLPTTSCQKSSAAFKRKETGSVKSSTVNSSTPKHSSDVGDSLKSSTPMVLLSSGAGASPKNSTPMVLRSSAKKQQETSIEESNVNSTKRVLHFPSVPVVPPPVNPYSHAQNYQPYMHPDQNSSFYTSYPSSYPQTFGYPSNTPYNFYSGQNIPDSSHGTPSYQVL